MKIFLTILLMLLAFFQYQLWFSGNGYIRGWHLRKEIAKQQQVTQSLNERNNKIIGEVSDLKQGSDAIEESARQQLGMVKKNEVFYRIVPPTHNNPTVPAHS